MNDNGNGCVEIIFRILYIYIYINDWLYALSNDVSVSFYKTYRTGPDFQMIYGIFLQFFKFFVALLDRKRYSSVLLRN